jgi:hypothetical protein
MVHPVNTGPATYGRWTSSGRRWIFTCRVHTTLNLRPVTVATGALTSCWQPAFLFKLAIMDGRGMAFKEIIAIAKDCILAAAATEFCTRCSIAMDSLRRSFLGVI